MAAAGLPGDLPEEMINAMVPKKYMTSTPEKEPCDYPQPIIEKWHSGLLLLAQGGGVDHQVGVHPSTPLVYCHDTTQAFGGFGPSSASQAPEQGQNVSS